MRVWVLTSELNEYNQDGEYFRAVFKNKPTAQQLDRFMDPRTRDYVLATGGGRIRYEHEWFNLLEIDVA